VNPEFKKGQNDFLEKLMNCEKQQYLYVCLKRRTWKIRATLSGDFDVRKRKCWIIIKNGQKKNRNFEILEKKIGP
jgi:hypothetical protein